jgi:hypothetical protein
MEYTGYVFEGGLPPSYAVWAAQWGTAGGTNIIGEADDDYDNDGLDNTHEYGVDGDPTDPLNLGTASAFSKAGSGYIYVHPQRTDDTTLNYQVQTTTDLLTTWTGQGTVVGTNVTGGLLDFVTNTVDAVEDEKFIRLNVEL